MYSFRITHEVSVRSLDVLTQLQEMATSGVHEHYPMISFTRDNPFPNRLRQSGRVWRIALVQTLNKQTASRNAKSCSLQPIRSIEALRKIA